MSECGHMAMPVCLGPECSGRHAREEATRACNLAYDAEGKLMACADWMKKLQGADVLVKWFARAAPDTKKDDYQADIDEVRLVKTARSIPTSPCKRARDDTTHGATESCVQEQKGTRNNC